MNTGLRWFRQRRMQAAQDNVVAFPGRDAAGDLSSMPPVKAAS
jgi:hypothetical protein